LRVRAAFFALQVAFLLTALGGPYGAVSSTLASWTWQPGSSDTHATLGSTPFDEFGYQNWRTDKMQKSLFQKMRFFDSSLSQTHI